MVDHSFGNQSLIHFILKVTAQPTAVWLQHRRCLQERRAAHIYLASLLHIVGLFSAVLVSQTLDTLSFFFSCTFCDCREIVALCFVFLCPTKSERQGQERVLHLSPPGSGSVQPGGLPPVFSLTHSQSTKSRLKMKIRDTKSWFSLNLLLHLSCERKASFPCSASVRAPPAGQDGDLQLLRNRHRQLHDPKLLHII